MASRLGSAAHAATPYTETFDASLAGWTAARFGSASAVSGHAQLQFNVQGGPPTPQTGVFSATNTSSGGAFYGDWSTARVAFVGFDVRCENVLPQELNLVLRAGAGQVFRRALAAQVTSTGLWHSLAVAVTSTNQGRWIGGSEAAFAAALTNIMAFEIEIARSGPGVAQLYLVDNVYVEERPGALDITAVADQHQLSWSPLRSNRTYRLQRAAGPTSGWTDHQAVIATNTVTTWTVDATNGSAGVWRLLNLVH